MGWDELDNLFKEYTAHDTKCNIYLLYISDTAAVGKASLCNVKGGQCISQPGYTAG